MLFTNFSQNGVSCKVIPGKQKIHLTNSFIFLTENDAQLTFKAPC